FARASYPIQWPGHWLDNAWQETLGPGTERASTNPSRDQSLIRFSCSKATVGRAIDIAQATLESMREFSFSDRIRLLNALSAAMMEDRALLPQAMQLEPGKPAWEAYTDVEAACRYLAWIVANQEGIWESLLAPARLGAREGAFSLHPVGVTA